MTGKRILAAGTVLSLLALYLCPVCNAVSAPDISARSAIVMDRLSGTVLYEKNADQRSLIASTTKIMTGLLVCQMCDPAQKVTIPAEVCGTEGSSLYLKAGECCTVEELLYGMMLHSGNDAAAALAIITCGSQRDFVRLMNDRAAQLGLKDTHFANPHGLDSDENYSTARDLAMLSRAALDNALFAQIVATHTRDFGDRCFVNHNKLLGRYDGADGVKTGYTKAAGRILVSSATCQGRQLVVVTIDAPDDWNDHQKLLDYGFAQFQEVVLFPQNTCLGTVPSASCNAEPIRLRADKPVKILLLDGERPEIHLTMPRLYYETESPRQWGKVEIRLYDRLVAVCPLTAE